MKAIRPEPLPDDFSAALSALRGELGIVGSMTLFFSTVDSTNDVAASLAAQGCCEGAVVVADRQTSGRGRRGHSWFSPPGAGLYVSVVLRPGRVNDAAARATSLLTLTAGVALAEAIERVSGLRADIKWPNDLLFGRRKVAGILAEGVTAPESAGLQSVVLGYGINAAMTSYPSELGDRATSLESELGRPIDRATLLVATLASLDARYRDLMEARFDVILDAWRLRAPGHRNARVSWETVDGPRRGTTVDVDDHGALIVQTADGLERIVAGEVRWE